MFINYNNLNANQNSLQRQNSSFKHRSKIYGGVTKSDFKISFQKKLTCFRFRLILYR